MKKYLILRALLGLIFIYASVGKIIHPEKFVQVLINYRLFPDISLNLIAIILPWLELFTGLSLLTGVFLEGGLIWSNILLMAFFLAIFINFLRGLNIECGCFNLKASFSSKYTMLWYMIRDMALLIISLYLTWCYIIKDERRER